MNLGFYSDPVYANRSLRTQVRACLHKLVVDTKFCPPPPLGDLHAKLIKIQKY